MRTQHGLNTKTNNIMKKLFLVAKAEEGETTTSNNGEVQTTAPTINLSLIHI